MIIGGGPAGRQPANGGGGADEARCGQLLCEVMHGAEVLLHIGAQHHLVGAGSRPQGSHLVVHRVHNLRGKASSFDHLLNHPHGGEESGIEC